MRVPRVHVGTVSDFPAMVDLEQEEAMHLTRVLRRHAGDPVLCIVEGRGILDGSIAAIDSDGRVTLRISGPRGTGAGEEPGLPCRGRDRSGLPAVASWSVAPALVKGEGLETAVRMASELGLRAFLPIVTERTVVRWDGRARKLERWRRIALEAAKQCGRLEPLRVEAPVPLDAILSASGYGGPGGGPCDGAPAGPGEQGLAGPLPVTAKMGWILDPGAPFCPESLLARASQPATASPEAERLFLVGPEGGFTRGELSRAAAAGFTPLGLPLPVLRTPTAVALVAALALVLREAAWAPARASTEASPRQ